MRKNIKLIEIKLDKKNPRYATRKNKQENVSNFMIKHTKLSYINDMVKDVALNGLSPLDAIAVFKENNQYIALDGNRRILALKIIFDNNEIVIPHSTKDILDEYGEYAKSKVNIDKIEVFVFENRDNAKKWLDRKHTSDFGGASPQDWPTLEKKIFQEDKLGLFISANADEAGVTYDDYAINVKYTIWERFFTSDFSRRWLGVTYNKELKEFEIIKKKQLFERMRAIVSATKNAELNFQKVNKKTDKIKTIKMINEKYLSETKFDTDFKINSPTKASKIKKKKNKLIKNIKNLNDYIDNEKLNTILAQINKLNIKNYTELISMSIRPLIEITCWEYLTRELKKSNEWFKKNDLKDRIYTTITEIEKTQFEARNKTTMKKIKINIEDLILATNGDIHDVQFVSTKKELEDNLKRVTILLEEIWRKIN